METQVNQPVRWITRFVAGTILVLLAILFLSMLLMTAPEAQISNEPRPARSVIVLEAQQHDVRRQFDGYGVADALHHADVPARVSSTVVSLPANSRAGNSIAKDQLLVQLDDTDFVEQVTIASQQIADIESQLASLALEQSAADDRKLLSEEEVQIAQRDYERIQEAAAKEAAHPREVDQMRQALIAKQSALITAREKADQVRTRRTQLLARQRSEEANQRIAQQRIERCRITSPLNGLIESVDVKIGENLPVGARVARVVDPSIIEVPLRLSSAIRNELAVGDPVVLFATGSSDATWEARVVRIAPEDDPATRTTTVYVELEQDVLADDYLAPGMFLRGEVLSGAAIRSWVVPRRAVLNDRLMLVRDNLIRSMPVTVLHAVNMSIDATGLPDRDWLVLETPMQEGDLLVVTPSRSLTDGLPVMAVPASEALASLEREEESVQ